MGKHTTGVYSSGYHCRVWLLRTMPNRKAISISQRQRSRGGYVFAGCHYFAVRLLRRVAKGKLCLGIGRLRRRAGE